MVLALTASPPLECNDCGAYYSSAFHPQNYKGRYSVVVGVRPTGWTFTPSTRAKVRGEGPP